MKIRNTIFALGLGAASVTAAAVSLGNASGSVVLGAPVDLTFQLQPDPGSDVASSCVSAKVAAGDTVISDQKVRITPNGATSVRLRASITVDEPVLRVTLSAGCVGAVTRTYTFLVDLPSTLRQAPSAMPLDLARLAGAAGAASAVSSTSPLPAVAQATPPGAVARTQATAGQPETNSPRAQRMPLAGRSPAVQASPRNAAPTAAKPRLQIEPLDNWLDLPVALRATSQLLAMPSQDDSAQRAQAQALWSSLNAQPEAAQQASERVKTLETDAATAQARAAQDRAELVQLRQQLERAEQERFSYTVVYVLGGLLMLALLLAAWAWSRVRNVNKQAEKAWHDSIVFGAKDTPRAGTGADLDADTVGDLSDTGLNLVAPDLYPLQDSAHPSIAKVAPAIAPEPFKAVPSVALQPVESPRAQPQFVRSGFAASQAPLQIVNPEDLLDIQQQAEFYTSVGEHDRAIDVLKEHIADHQETSPLAYLELLRLYHTLSRVEDFAQLRAQFMSFFNAQVPEFSGFHRPGQPLWHYTEALAEIEAQWTTPGVVQLLEALMFRSEDVQGVQPFDLAAYDDLLLLLAIAQTTPAGARGAAPPRQRTTPAAKEAVASEVMQDLPVAQTPPVRKPSDTLDPGLNFDMATSPQQWESIELPTGFGVSANGRLDFDVPLDLDLSEPPPLTMSDLPEIPVSAPPTDGQPIGFGTKSDLFEVRFEEELSKKRNK